jgi:polyhydroxyalkanoate synthesis regulator phasin
MHPKMIAKQIIDFNKASFDHTFDTLTVLQDHTEKMVELFLERATIFPEEGKKVITDWVKVYKKGREDFKSSVDDSFKYVEDFFVNAANNMGFSMYGIVERTDQSLRDVTDKIKKASVEVVDKSIQTMATIADKTARKQITSVSKSGADLAGIVRKSGNKSRKK